MKAARILLRRTGALGDVIMTTPVVRRLRLENPGAVIHVETGCPEVYAGNHHLSEDDGMANGTISYDRFIDLDFAYEASPRMHAVDAYFMTAFGDTDGDKSTTMSWHGAERADNIIIHPAKSWPNRTLSREFWYKVAGKIINSSRFGVRIVGRSTDSAIRESADGRVQSMIGQTSLGGLVSLIAGARCVIASDSSVIHVAGATETPIVGIYTSVRAAYRMPYRHGELGWRVRAFEPDIECAGCLADEPAPATICGCRRGDLACLDLIDPHAVAEAAIRLASTES
jgi:ADP-heptose:LPS heptosyltransferase